MHETERRDSASPQLVATGKQQLEAIVKNYISSKLSHHNVSELPVGTCERIPVDHTAVPSEISETNSENSETNM